VNPTSLAEKYAGCITHGIVTFSYRFIHGLSDAVNWKHNKAVALSIHTSFVLTPRGPICSPSFHNTAKEILNLSCLLKWKRARPLRHSLACK
jgi:hypothetical protein